MERKIKITLFALLTMTLTGCEDNLGKEVES